MLYLIRHAKSSWENTALSDFERPLNDRGERDAPVMGQRLKIRNVTPDLILSSPANRAFKTATIIAASIGYPAEKIKTDKNLYHAEDAELLRIVQQLDDAHQCVWLFGHNPGLTDFVNQLTTEFIDNIPTCGIVACSLAVTTWDEVDWKKGTVVYFDYPKKG